MEAICQHLLKMPIACDPADPLLGVNPQEMNPLEGTEQSVLAALFGITLNWKQPIKKRKDEHAVHIHTAAHSTAATRTRHVDQRCRRVPSEEPRCRAAHMPPNGPVGSRRCRRSGAACGVPGPEPGGGHVADS